ncbi:MAG: energy transducer TonB [Bacteroidales bacterium]|jgi:protein TonB|nr:energy transducer TonB [Bacteroidales bacterium]MBQ5958727.1 energy transducer TonB [Bacteroidales bacterium]MBR6273053.1 energy transducer TonB [Bacteroidales bacterium]
MEEKKSPKANLENKKLMFTQIGLIISLAVAWVVFEIKSYDKREFADIDRTVEIVEEEMVEITKQEQKPQPVEVPKQTTQIQVVEDDVEVEDIEINADVDQNEVIEEYVAPEVEEEEVVEAEVFTIVEEMPEYPGGLNKLTDYLSKNIKYPQMARESGIQGRVFVNFVVEPDGSVSNVNVMRSLGGGCDEEAVRVVKAMPKWKPGRQRGKAVRVSYILPIVFKLQ